MPSEMIQAKLVKKAGNGKGFILDGYEGWFNANDKVVPFLAKIEEGRIVEVSYFKKGVKREVTLIKEVGEGEAKAPKETSKETNKGTYTNCAICGKELKGKGVNYPNCWDCKDKAPKEEKKTEEPRKEWTSKSNYGSAEDVAGKEVGCAANCAAQILAGSGTGEMKDILERFRTLFNEILEHIRANK